MAPTHSTLVATAVSVFDVALSLVASGHVILTKRDTRAAIGWIGLIWLSPLLGTAIYVVLGINRINRKARLSRRGRRRPIPSPTRGSPAASESESVLVDPHLDALVELVGRITDRPLLAGNMI